MLSHLVLARGMARKYRRISDEQDLYAEGCLGLVEASRRYDPTRGLLFSTYAKFWVAAFVLDYLRRTRCVAGTKTQRHAGVNVELTDVYEDTTPHADELLYEADLVRIGRSMLELCKNDREREIIFRRWLSEDGCRLADLSKAFGVTHQYVQQLEKALFARIRRVFDIGNLLRV